MALGRESRIALTVQVVFVQQDAASILAESEFTWDHSTPENDDSPVIGSSLPARKVLPQPVSEKVVAPHPAPSSGSRRTIPRRPSLWPLGNRDEAMLICYFSNDVAPWVVLPSVV